MLDLFAWRVCRFLERSKNLCTSCRIVGVNGRRATAGWPDKQPENMLSSAYCCWQMLNNSVIDLYFRIPQDLG